jgi:3-dehydroquinate synthetase
MASSISRIPSFRPFRAEMSTATRLVVLDHSIEDLYVTRIGAYFEANGATVKYLTLPGSEENKSWKTP